MQLYNSLPKRKEEFSPVRGNKISLYACGITAYDYCHIGHARSNVAFDTLVRYLRHLGYEVTFIRNFTDVDDKIINRANEEGLSSEAVARKYIDAFHEDMDRLGILRADVEPKATEHIQEMLELTATLIDKGHAYATPAGDVYFRVRSFPEYGKLSGRSVDDLRSGVRIDPDENKEDPLDFALWKAAKPGEPSWESPWGPGRPGWHIECSAMSQRYAPLPLDIHGGGLDRIFPHHENEIAQSEAAKGGTFSRFWVHNGFVQVDSEKMSKSLGNFKTIRDILEGYLPEVLRFFLVSRHYRSPIDFTYEAMEDTEKNLRRFYETMAQVREELKREKWAETPLAPEFAREFDELENAWKAAMDDDLNTAAAIGHMNNYLRVANRLMENKETRKSREARELLTRFLENMDSWGAILGVFRQEPAEFLKELRDCRARRIKLDIPKIEELMQKRLEARRTKNFAEADKLREAIGQLGVAVRDTPQGAVWDIP